jgi:hypothetical protein
MNRINQPSFDKRTVDRYIEKGLVKRADYDTFLKGLPDESANAEWVEVEMDAAEFEGGDDAEEISETEELT